MSKYSERHTTKPPCVEPHCSAPGEKLLLIGKVPYWVCETHQQQRQHGRTA